jgi:alkylhydroperoxidase family enzyme
MLGFKQAFRLWRRRRQHRERGKAALEQSGWRSAVQAQSERSATRSAISAPRTMRLGADERYPLRVQLQRATRPRRSSSNPAALVLAPVPTRDRRRAVNWPVASPLDHGITCVGIRQLCAAQSEFSMEDAYRMTPSQAFVSDPPVDASVTAAYEDDLASDGYINNSTRVWCWRPDVLASFQTLRAGLRDSSDLSGREVAAMVAATAAARGDPYCSLAWGARLAELSDEATAARVLQGDPSGLSSREAALARWSRQVVLDSNAPTQADVDHLRDVGFSDREIFEATAFIAFRLAFSTINNALGAQPDQELIERVPPLVREAVTYGRPRTE